jgi:TatD DNase family protein
VVWLTDTHCHLNLNIFQEELPQVLERARQQGVSRILVPGIDLATSRLAVELSRQYEEVFAAVGIHPHDAAGWTPSTLAALRDLARQPKTVAVGEIGLDYYRDRSPRSTQREVFQAQLELAIELNLPVVLHNREATTDLWEDLENWQARLVQAASPLIERPGVLHSFDGDLPTGRRAVEIGFWIGISGPITFKNAALRQEVAGGLPIDRLLIETDAPYLTPHPYRGRRNEPAYVALVADKLSSLHGLSTEALQTITWQNADKLFHWGASL